jgi:hypothetical protein
LFDGRTEVEIMQEVLNPGTVIEQVGQNLNYLWKAQKGSAVMESDGIFTTIYLTERSALKEEYRGSLEVVEPVFLWNIFHPHKPHRNEVVTEKTWTFVLAAPRATKEELPEYQLQRFAREGIVGKFLFSDWLFNCYGGNLLLSEVYQITGNGSLYKQNGEISIPIVTYA